MAWWEGKLDDQDLWRHGSRPGGAARCLYIQNMVLTKQAWFAMGFVIRALDPAGIVFTTENPIVSKHVARWGSVCGSVTSQGVERWMCNGKHFQDFKAFLKRS